MPDSSLSQQLQANYQRMRSGDPAAREEFFQQACGRLMALARKIKRDFPEPGKLVDTGDVLSDAYLRLHRSLQQVDPPTLKLFFGLVALKIRQVLLDLCDRVKHPNFVVAHGEDSDSLRLEPIQSTMDPQKLVGWSDFHRCVNELPEDEREVVDLIWYHDLTPPEAADILEIDATTVRRRWRKARLSLAKSIGLSTG